MTSNEFSMFLIKLCDNYSIISVEDPFSENDWNSWSNFNNFGNKIQIVGDDIYTTNAKLIDKGIKAKTSNAVLINSNQIGTLTETM